MSAKDLIKDSHYTHFCFGMCPTCERSYQQMISNLKVIIKTLTPVEPIKVTTPNPSDPILRELIEETIAKSHRQWRSIPETAVLVLKAIEDYGVEK